MKKLTVFLAMIMISCVVYSAEPLTYSKVIQADSLDKTSTHVALRMWFTEFFKSANHVIQMDDKDAGIIIGKGSTKYNYGGLTYLCYEGYINFTVKVQIRDGRYKAEVSNIIHENLPKNSRNCNLGLMTTDAEHRTKGLEKSFQNKVADHIKNYMRTISEDIFAEMQMYTNNAIISEIQEDW
jgi:hypothetical protein